MKKIYSIGVCLLALEAGSFVGNELVHGYRMIDAIKESRKSQYGPNLAQEWKSYSEYQRERMFSPQVLLPFSSLGGRQPPLKVSFTNDSGIDLKLKFDVE